MPAQATSDERTVAALLAAAILTVGLGGCGNSASAKHPDFDAGRAALQRGQFEPAIEKLESYMSKHPHGKLRSRACFLMGKAYMGMGKYDDARAKFDETIRDYPESEEAHKAHYKLAMLSLLEGDEADARKRFAQLVDEPSGVLVPESNAMLKFLDRPADHQPRGEK